MWPALITAGASLVGSLFSAKSAKETNQANISQAEATNAFNAEEAQKNRDFQDQEAQKEMDFQERMSNTAHQREVKDLEAAGLNPVLSANAGASSPSGAMGSGSSASGVKANIENPYGALPAEILNTASAMSNILTQAAQQKSYLASASKDAAETVPLHFLNRGFSAIDQYSAKAARYLGTVMGQLPAAPSMNWSLRTSQAM